MDLIQWGSALEVGHAAIDTQHVKWIGLVNALNAAMAAGKGKEILGKLLDDLSEYTSTQFAMEERLMEARSYPARVQHMSAHSELRAALAKLQGEFAANRLMITIDVMHFLRDWLTDHIRVTDKALGKFLAPPPLDF